MAKKASKTQKVKHNTEHISFVWLLVVILAILATTGWVLYFLRSSQAQTELQKAQSERDSVLQRLEQYEDNDLNTLFNDYQ